MMPSTCRSSTLHHVGCCVALGVLLSIGCAQEAPTDVADAPEAASPAASGRVELTRIVDRMLAPPAVQAADRFNARVLMPPGELYDPLFLRSHPTGAVRFNDDGGKKGDKGSRILAVGDEGRLTTVVPLGRLMPNTGFDIAPASFGSYAGYVYGVAQPRVGGLGVGPNHLIQRVDPAGNEDGEIVCTLPDNDQGTPGVGVEARFGPDGSPFEGESLRSLPETRASIRSRRRATAPRSSPLIAGCWARRSGSSSRRITSRCSCRRPRAASVLTGNGIAARGRETNRCEA